MAARRHNRGYHRRHRVSRELTLRDGALITGGWYLTGRELRTATPRLLALRPIADAQSHELPIPARITRWPEPNTNSH